MIRPWLSDLPTGDYWLRRARVPVAMLEPVSAPADDEGNVAVDLKIADSRIAAIAPAGSGADGIDMDGGQVWPGLVDAHVHLDKTQIWPRTTNPDGTHSGARLATGADRANWTEDDVRARFEFGLECAYAHGTIAMRTHIDSYWPHARIGWKVFREMRERWAGRIALQAVSICPPDRFLGDEGTALADEVATSGGVLGMVTNGLGAVDPPTLAELQYQIDHFFSLAEERGLAIDVHLDETGEASATTLRLMAETVLRRDFRRPVQCGHCCALAIQPEAEARQTIRLVAEAGIAVVVLPMCNMYLQGRVAGVTPRWRGITLVHELRAAGVAVSFASDNCRDPFYAYGDYDMVEVHREAVRIAQLDHPFGAWVGSVSTVPAASLGLNGVGRIAVGATADLLLFRARGMTELLARPQSDRVVLRAGRVLDAVLPDFRRLDPVVVLRSDAGV
jgi:cytosine/creatinine deaminase